jgi:leucyl aminopeptidase
LPDCLSPAHPDATAVPVDAVTADRLSEFRESLEPRSAAWLAATGFSAAGGKVAVLPDNDGRVASVVLGLGSREDATPLLPGALPPSLPAGDYRLRRGFADPAKAALAWALGAYRFTRYRPATSGARRLVLPDGVDGGEVARIADGAYLARDLVNTAANDLGPAELAAAAANLARRHGAVFSEIVGEGLIADGLPLIHAVGAAAGSDRAPRLIDIGWGEEDHPKVTIVGKGVCFDTGGLDIKTAAGMLLMKKDMGGAANALGLAHMIMDAKLKLRLRVLIPAVENAISAGAFRPGDVITSRKGLTVEVDNTDAEGRLVLADALALAAEEEPALIIDLATLTGAARVALGPDVVPIYTSDDGLAADLVRIGAEVADPVWRMPLWRPYMAMLDSKVADIANTGQGSFAGSITAALFLSRFVPDSISWLHADIYAWTPKARPGKPEGGEAQAIRALYGMLKERFGA